MTNAIIHLVKTGEEIAQIEMDHAPSIGEHITFWTDFREPKPNIKPKLWKVLYVNHDIREMDTGTFHTFDVGVELR